jgi:hypothetical protein
MGKGEVQMMKGGFRVIISLLSAGATMQAGEIRLSHVEEKMLPVAVEALADEVKTGKEFTGLTVWKNGKVELAKESHREDLLGEVFKAAAENDAGKEAFFGASEHFFVQEAGSDKGYLLIVEKTGKRFRIAPLEAFGEGWWMQKRSAQTSRNPQLLAWVGLLRKAEE